MIDIIHSEQRRINSFTHYSIVSIGSLPFFFNRTIAVFPIQIKLKSSNYLSWSQFKTIQSFYVLTIGIIKIHFNKCGGCKQIAPDINGAAFELDGLVPFLL